MTAPSDGDRPIDKARGTRDSPEYLAMYRREIRATGDFFEIVAECPPLEELDSDALQAQKALYTRRNGGQPGAWGKRGEQRPRRAMQATQLCGPAFDPAAPVALPGTPGPIEIDDDTWRRAQQAHPDTVATLARHVRETLGVIPRTRGPGEPDFDLAWSHSGVTYVAEVKSLPANLTGERGKLRLALGQVLDYRHALEHVSEPVAGVVVVERRPREDRWARFARTPA